MKTGWLEGAPLDDWPKGIKKKMMGIEPSHDGFWCYYAEHRSAGRLPETPFHNRLVWLVEQIALGYCKAYRDESGDEVSLTIGKGAPQPAASEAQAADDAVREHLALNIAGLIAEAREKGLRPELEELYSRMWQEGTDSAFRRMEMHYALELARLLGRISKKLPTLEHLPIVEHAPETTRAHIAEATRCYLLKLDRACIALCRACLENTLTNVLTPIMRQEWCDLMDENKRRFRKPNQMHALIEVCAKHGILKDIKAFAHDVRKAGNTVLHLEEVNDEQKDLASEVLKKTRTIVGLIYGSGKSKPSRPGAPASDY